MGKDSGEDYQLGVALVSILVSILFSVLFGVYSMSANWWLSIALAVGVVAALAGLIRVGGEDGVVPRIGKWVLGKDGSSQSSSQ